MLTSCFFTTSTHTNSHNQPIFHLCWEESSSYNFKLCESKNQNQNQNHPPIRFYADETWVAMMIQRFRQFIILATILSNGLFLVGCLASTDASTSSSSAPPSIPRSSERIASSYGDRSNFPPWNPSPNIDENGFLLPTYHRISGEWEKEVKLRKKDRISIHNSPATIRQVPGDGNCLFHSISTCYAHAINGTHLDMRAPDTMEWLYRHSTKLRQLAVDCLEERRKLLFLQGHEYLNARDLVEAAAVQYGISGNEYCDLMRQESYWGGGPEIVALCNVLQRPIHVYELCVPDDKKKENKRNRKKGNRNRNAATIDVSRPTPTSPFVLRRMACFGSPKFDRSPALHILSADSRFPDITPGEQLESGNHFLAIFPSPTNSHPQSDEEENKQRIRGGGREITKVDEGNNKYVSGWWRRFWSSL